MKINSLQPCCLEYPPGTSHMVNHAEQLWGFIGDGRRRSLACEGRSLANFISLLLLLIIAIICNISVCDTCRLSEYCLHELAKIKLILTFHVYNEAFNRFYLVAIPVLIFVSDSETIYLLHNSPNMALQYVKYHPYN